MTTFNLHYELWLRYKFWKSDAQHIIWEKTIEKLDDHTYQIGIISSEYWLKGIEEDTEVELTLQEEMYTHKE